MTQRTRRRKTGNDRFLLIAVGVLVVLLIIAVCVALSLDRGSQEQPGNTTPGTDPTATAFGTEPSEPLPLRILTITEPAKQEFVTVEKELVFTGTADSREKLTIGGQTVQYSKDGSFSHAVRLNSGMNTIDVVYMGQTTTYTVEYRYAVEKVEPAKAAEYNSGATIQISVSARQGSTVKVTFNGRNITMTEARDQVGSGVAAGFVLYTGTYKLPSDNGSDLDLGQIVYTVTCDGVTETYSSGTITCKKSADITNTDPAVTPDYGNYIDVGSGYIVEILGNSAETFNGKTRDDYSDPRNNYLPAGTVDYGSSKVVYDTTGKIAYRLLRCGRRVYVQKNNYPPPENWVKVVDCYKGTLPDHNEIGFSGWSQSGHFTELTLDTLWKAPFYFDIAPQSYADPGSRNFLVSDLTAEYIDITFCYATVFEGQVQVPANNPLFRSAELTRRESDCTLRLYLKEKGGFYGWDAYYNDNDQLCFKFLNPVKATAADNIYGADLTGIRIMIDVGHGGMDGGSAVKDPSGSTVEEAERNLVLAMALKRELESMGATVILNRTGDESLTVDERNSFIKEQAPDFCIALHHNAYAPLSSVNGCEVRYFGPTSQAAAQEIYQQIVAGNIYNKTALKWHVYYVARQTVCPVVLIEAGYMTNPQDLAGMLDPETISRKAEDMAQGIANYFLNNG